MTQFPFRKAYRKIWLVMTLGLSVILLGLVVLGSQIIREIKLQEEQIQTLYQHPFTVNAAARDASLAAALIQNHLLELRSAQDKTEIAKEISAYTAEHDQKIAEDLAIISAYFLGDMAKVKEAKQLLREWKGARAVLINPPLQGDQTQAGHSTEHQANSIYGALTQRLDYIREFSANKALSLASEAEVAAAKSTRNFKAYIFALILFTAATGGVTLVLVSAQLMRHDKNVTQEHEHIERLAHYDILTNLPNRALFLDRLKQSISLAKREHGDITVMFMDLDGFKHVNDTLGHHSGDLLLKQVAERLTQCVRESDTIGRNGGDEFTLILTNVNSRDHVSAIAAKIIQAIQPPFDLEGKPFQISISIGIASEAGSKANRETLLHNADIAMYWSKQHGKNRHTFFSDISRVSDSRWMLSISELKRLAGGRADR